jgi:CRP/FNR family cyclic AMP-dependent transcriptional regulator
MCMPGDGFLDHLRPDDRAALLALGRRRHYAQGQVLFYEGDEGRDVYLLLSGQVKASIASAAGREIILDVIDGGELLGELSAIDREPRSATVTALTEVEVIIAPTDEFLGFLAARPRVALAFVQLIAARLRRTSHRQLEFGTSDALGRLCGCLLEMTERYGTEAGGARRVSMPIAQHDVAAITGLSREAVVKGLRALRALGWIEARGRDVVVRDEAALRSRAQA